jgi:hypothetical protein
MATAKRGGGQKGLLWRLPEVTSKELGKIGPAFGLGIGCGAGIGLFGGKTLFILAFPLLRVSLVDWKVISTLICACSLRVKRLLIASGSLVRIMSGARVNQDGILWSRGRVRPKTCLVRAVPLWRATYRIVW